VKSQFRHDFSVPREFDRYTVQFSDAPDDPRWDDFLEHMWSWSICPQTSGWGRARASIGWQSVRMVISEGSQIVAGAQMMTRPLPVGGNIGFVCRGPVVRGDRPNLVRLAFDGMMAMGRELDVQYLVVQPPRTGEWMCSKLSALGFRPGPFDIDVTATTRIDLSRGIDGLFAAASDSCREYVTLAQKSGITVRRGSITDLPIFNDLKDVHSARLGYTRRKPGYYEELWRSLADRGHIELFIAEREARPVSALLVVPFGGDCYHMERVWSGEHGDLGANELLEWEVVKWAKSQSYCFSDLDGIERAVAAAILSGGAVSDDPRFSESLFKLQFGGQVIVDPPSFHYFFNPLLRFVYRFIPKGVMRSTWLNGIMVRFRPAGS